MVICRIMQLECHVRCISCSPGIVDFPVPVSTTDFKEFAHLDAETWNPLYQTRLITFLSNKQFIIIIFPGAMQPDNIILGYVTTFRGSKRHLWNLNIYPLKVVPCVRRRVPAYAAWFVIVMASLLMFILFIYCF